jgi:hypothetical protein
LNTNNGNRNVYNAIKAECENRDIELVYSQLANTGIYENGKRLICTELLGGIFIIPTQLTLRMKFLMTSLADDLSSKSIAKYLPKKIVLSEDACKLIILPELSVLEITASCCVQLVDWAKGEKCLVLPMHDTPDALLRGMEATGNNFTILPIDSDKTSLLLNATDVFCSTVSEAGIEATLLGKPFSFMKEGRPHDIGAFRLLNILLANNPSTRTQRLMNFINSKSTGLFLPGRDGPEELRTYLKYYEENYEKITYSHST